MTQVHPFTELGLPDLVVKAIEDLGFVSPTPIQEKAIPVLLNQKQDFVGLASTGTGKTAAFGLPLLTKIDIGSKTPQALILCPTRELCLQITNDIKNFSKYLKGVNVVAIYGGANIVNQLRDIKKGCQIVVATPGRMLDVLNRKAIDFSNVQTVVLDEADEMLNMGFQEDINSILSTTPNDKNTWLFSATMPAEVRAIAGNYMNKPFELTVGQKNAGNEGIDHEYYIVRARDKYAALKRIVDFNPEIFGIVFTRTKLESQEIAENLIKDGYNADALHGDLSQQQRDKVMQRYRNKNLQILVATDVAARGIDVNNVTHVINYSLPDDIESYTHRSGRTARAGKKGISLAIINKKEVGRIRQIERMIKKTFTHAQIPGGFEVCEKQLFALIHKIHNIDVAEEQIEAYLPRIYKEFDGLTKEELIKRFTLLEFNRFLEYYKNAPDLNESEDRRSGGSDQHEMRGGRGKFTRLFMNLGSLDDFNRGDMLKFICDNGRITGRQVGRIDIKGVYSFFEVDNDVVDSIFSGFRSVDFEGRKVRIELSSDGDRKGSYGGGSGSGRSGGNRERSGGSRERSGGGGNYSGGSRSGSSGGGNFKKRSR